MPYRCAGPDINKAAIKHISEKWYIKDIYYCDATKEIPEELKLTKWNYIIAAELIEHIDNPVDFLKKISNIWKNIVNEIIFTTPNTFSYNNFREATLFGERNSPDHRFWFTSHTLAKVCFLAGLIPYEFFLVNKVFKKKKPIFDHLLWFQNRFPLLRTNLIMKCKF
jgi:2-polyprenyl-3-methyl-5-hydroxy-6-metoxy-1,4-benzoquinol methylase